MLCVILQDNPKSDQTPLPQTRIVPVPKVGKASRPLRTVLLGLEEFILTALASSMLPSFLFCAIYSDQLVIMESRSAGDEKPFLGRLSSGPAVRGKTDL